MNTNRHCFADNWYISTFIVLLWVGSICTACWVGLCVMAVCAVAVVGGGDDYKLH